MSDEIASTAEDTGTTGRWQRGGLGLGLGLTLCACAIVGPLTDSDMSRAPHFACVDMAPNPIPVASSEWVPTGGSPGAAAPIPAPAPSCFVLAAQDAEGNRSRWTGGAIEPGRALIAVHSAAAECAGTFTHLTLTGSSNAAGRLEMATFELMGRGGHHREVRWSEGFAGRTYSLASIESATMNPSGARITVAEGTFEPQRLCFRSY